MNVGDVERTRLHHRAARTWLQTSPDLDVPTDREKGSTYHDGTTRRRHCVRASGWNPVARTQVSTRETTDRLPTARAPVRPPMACLALAYVRPRPAAGEGAAQLMTLGPVTSESDRLPPV